MSLANPYGDGFSFIFPPTDGVHYLVPRMPVRSRGAISMTYSIDAPAVPCSTIAPRPTTHAVLAFPAP